MMIPSRRVGVRALAMAASLLVPLPAAAQSSLQVPLQFDFLNPGAKSRAMGGAFVAVADDATAVLTNPAGLLLIPESEVSVEFRRLSLETRYLAGGRLSGTIFNSGTDTVQGPTFGESRQSDAGLGFLSAVYRRRAATTARIPWRVAGYRHELVRVDQSFSSTGVFQKSPLEFTSRREAPQQLSRSVSITSYGATVAVQPTSQLAVGAGLGVYRFALETLSIRFDTVDFLGAPDLDAEFARGTQSGDDTSLAPTFGVMWGVSTPWRVGVLYRRGASFEFETVEGTLPSRTGEFRLPHTFAVGASTRLLHDTLTVSGEITRVEYARLREDFVTDQAVSTGHEEDFFVKSGTEVHFGAQYYPTTSFGAPQFRFGVWRDPNHSVQYSPQTAPVTSSAQLFDERFRTALSSGRSLVHYTGGIGFSLSSHFEVSAGYDWSDQIRVFSTSVIVR